MKSLTKPRHTEKKQTTYSSFEPTGRLGGQILVMANSLTHLPGNQLSEILNKYVTMFYTILAKSGRLVMVRMKLIHVIRILMNFVNAIPSYLDIVTSAIWISEREDLGLVWVTLPL